ncbi:hypothetical protein DFJ63DRAFT_317236 [Scheffersomyces coipomensis]|uniref:uncharacterized protein n=1 Tax=Scheffersomyces coipomensis TaxID=1788519 RepID=UPI00315DEEFD
MDASCGPSNAITNLSKHAQRDNSLQNEAALRNNQQRNNIGSFRTNGNIVDTRLNSEFQQFNNGNDFASSFASQFKPQIPQQNIQQQPQLHNGNWVNDFSNLAINQPQGPIHQHHPAQQQHQQPNVRSDWNQQFLQQDNSQVQFQQPQQQNQQFMPNYANGLAMRNSPLFAQQQHQQVQPQVSEHQELHKMQQESKHFDNEFDMLEKELQDQEPAQDEELKTVDDSDKERFAETARQVQHSMQSATSTQETKSKFENSNFLKLMSSISNRQVELSGDKLVNSTNGEDIRQYLSDPLKDIKTENGNIHYHEPPHDIPIPVAPIQQQQQPQHDLRPEVNHLPDPLAHIKDGELGGILDPFSAAKVVSGGQVQMHDWMEDFDSVPTTVNNRRVKRSILTDKWQEVYDDYRHDDDFH